MYINKYFSSFLKRLMDKVNNVGDRITLDDIPYSPNSIHVLEFMLTEGSMLNDEDRSNFSELFSDVYQGKIVSVKKQDPILDDNYYELQVNMKRKLRFG